VAYKRRIEVPGAYYHVVTRGNNRRHIAHVDDDHRLFLMIVQSVAAAYGWKIIAYVLMPNHYHLVIKLGASEKGLSRGMCFLNTAYATEYNQRYKRINHLFGKRYWSRMIEDDVQLIRTCRYILLNPVRADLRAHPGDWTWSSYNAMLGRAAGFRGFDPHVLLAQFGREPEAARQRFEEFIEAAIAGPVPFEPVLAGHLSRQPP
jgi:REP element-mobilizing transposase RayT